MLLEGKKILIMGIRNKWSIAYGIAKSAYENGAKLIFTYRDETEKSKLEALTEIFRFILPSKIMQKIPKSLKNSLKKLITSAKLAARCLAAN